MFIIAVLLTIYLATLIQNLFVPELKGCFFIGNNSTAVELFFDRFDKNAKKDNCSALIDDANFTQSVTFLKFVGFKLYKKDDYKIMRMNKQEDMKEFENRFQGVRALDISNNSINRLESTIFNFKNLVFLNVSYNKLKDISSELFDGTPKLSEIDFSFNNIKSLWNVPFSNLAELRVIDLRNNNIRTIYGSFIDNKNLETLRLENNLISKIFCDTIKLLERSISIGISWDHVKTLDMNCLGNQLKISVENEEIIARTSYNHEEIMRIDKNNFSKLRRVHFGANQLANSSEILEMLGPSIKYLTLSGNFIGKLNASTFHRFTELMALDLERTNLSAFDGNPFENLKKLTGLSISHNNLNKLNVTSLNTTLTQLKVIFVAGNSLVNIHEIIEHLGPNLEALDVSQNFVGTLNTTTFERFSKLWNLKLSQTNLSAFDFNPFENLTKLAYLDLSNNKLRKLNATLLSPTIKQLAGLNIAGNNLENTYDIIPHLHSSVRVVDLSENYVGRIAEHTFSKCNTTEHLNLKRTNLTHFDIYNLRNMKHLTKLDISYNGLESVDLSSEKPLKWLDDLNVNGNNLTGLKGLTQASYPNLKQLHIKGNHFSCEYFLLLKQFWAKLVILGNPCYEQIRIDCSRQLNN